ncbi:signal transduction histidine kinase [Nocardiopsis mwathae]|uniref:histidine kinase n=1 Tax=Nocardiopsis mwathae TaxID=1472723 RepID=A0A7W9YFE0_9ACTN|nr:nitrate- and nitrite sensing domain-containing protein [Nocardiopsis mwathae]MBB6171082.1 signal transduction histidine kinase [Nocardiopsis mwathae]
MGQPGGADRSIKAQLNRIVLIPSITFLVLFAVLSTAMLMQAVSLRLATGDGRTGAYLYYAVAELQKERRLAAEHLADPSEESIKELRGQISGTDEAVRRVEDRRESLSGRGGTEVAKVASGFFTAVGRRDELRGHVIAGELGVEQTVAEYSAVVDRGIRLYDAGGRQLDDGGSAAASADVVDLMRAQDLFTRADAVLSAALAADRLTHDEQVRFAALMTAFQQRIVNAGLVLRGQTADAHAALTGSSQWEELDAMSETVSRNVPVIEVDAAEGEESGPDEEPPAGLDDWRTVADDVNADLIVLTDAQTQAVVSATDAASTWMFTIALGGGIMALFAGTIAYGVASKSAARLTTRLARLRAETLGLAREELPRIVRRLENGETVDLDTELKQLDHGTDEVGQVADAFNTAQRTAVSAAVKQAEIREGVNRVFLGIAHRNQSLVQRQLQLLDRVEREEEDPDLLEDLFHLDHLATRGRRNAENLIILGGAQPGRRWRNPIPLVDILRGAISETEEYARVKLRVVPDLALSGSVVADVIHLVAELVENATSFSPPHTPVHIHSEVVPKGVVVEIEDRGLGMSEAGLAEANATLSQAPEFDVMAMNSDSRLGLFVVARLAVKHDIHVQLCPSPYGGTRAIVLIPSALISPGEAAGRRRPAGDAADGGRPQDTVATPPQGITPAGGIPPAGGLTPPGGTTPPGGLTPSRGIPAPAQTVERGKGDLLAGQRGAGGRPGSAPGTVSGAPAAPRANGHGTPPGAVPVAPGTASTTTGPNGLPIREARRGDQHPPTGVPRPPEDTGGGAADQPALPRRRKQANLAAQLRNDPATPTRRGPETSRSPEEALRALSAFQSGTKRGREDDLGSGAAPQQNAAPAPNGARPSAAAPRTHGRGPGTPASGLRRTKSAPGRIDPTASPDAAPGAVGGGGDDDDAIVTSFPREERGRSATAAATREGHVGRPVGDHMGESD